MLKRNPYGYRMGLAAAAYKICLFLFGLYLVNLRAVPLRIDSEAGLGRWLIWNFEKSTNICHLQALHKVFPGRDPFPTFLWVALKGHRRA